MSVDEKAQASTCGLQGMHGGPGRGASKACRVELCIRSRIAEEAIRLTQLGARAGLVSQLTGLEKAAANRLYRQLNGRPSPPGQQPFTDCWYLKQDRRMLHATLVWHLSQRFARFDGTPAWRLINVYECYCWLVAQPLLDIGRVAFVPHLVSMQAWEEQTCTVCATRYLTPTGTQANTCWGCRLYHRHRCRLCGVALAARPKGRYRTVCSACQRARHRPAAGTGP